MSSMLAACLVAIVGWVARPRSTRRPVGTVEREPSGSAPQWRGPLARRRARLATTLGYPDAVEAVVLGVRAGYLPVAAMQAALPHLAPVLRAAFAAVVERAEGGERFADALAELPARLGAHAATLADTLAAADRDGLPIAPVLERLADEARQRRRRHADTLARQLPVRMSLPLVLCTLPSFVLLAIVPLLLAALSSLQQ